MVYLATGTWLRLIPLTNIDNIFHSYICHKNLIWTPISSIYYFISVPITLLPYEYRNSKIVLNSDIGNIGTTCQKFHPYFISFALKYNTIYVIGIKLSFL